MARKTRFGAPASPAERDAARARWRGLARNRPADVQEPGPGEESVWDYPRPPRLELCHRHVEVKCGGSIVAETTRPFRVCETASPPVYYVPASDVQTHMLVRASRDSFCEWKGVASYWHVQTDSETVDHAGWSYAAPDRGFERLAGAIAFYPGKLECFVDGERVTPQAGDFYGGWVTHEIVGPFKGEPGSEGW